MAIKLLFFAQCSGWVQRRELEVPFLKPETLEAVIRRHPELEPLWTQRGILKVAVNQEFAGFDSEVKDHDEIAFLPPTSGG